MSTVFVSPKDVKKDWILIDAEDLVLGRLASKVSMLLRGKHKPYYTPNIDCGDNIIIINAEKVALTGKKTENKTYYWHTGFPGGIKETTAKKVLTSKHPERVIIKAIERMISRNPLGRAQMKKLHVYAGSEHKHDAQKPTTLDFGALNRKNKKVS